MAIPAILLDFDDVLAETRALRIDALRSALAGDGIALPDERFDASCAGLSFAAGARAAYMAAGAALDETAIALAALRAGRAYSARTANGLALSSGAREFVLGAAGLARLGIVTRSARRDVELVLSLAGLDEAFECVVAEEDYSGPEPSPEPYAHARIRMASHGPVALTEGIALVASHAAIVTARQARFQPIAVGAVQPAIAFAADGYIPSLAVVRVADVTRIAGGARTS